MIKRISVITVIILLALTLVGCQSNEDVEKLTEAINSIGSVDINSISVITNAEMDYEELKDNKKELVENYEVLLEAREKYDKIKNFSDIGQKNEYTLYIKLSEDKLSISLDTNPLNKKDFIEPDIFGKIIELHEDLEFPESVYTKMMSTRSLDGIREQTVGDVTVSWTYHPNNGLEALYELNK